MSADLTTAPGESAGTPPRPDDAEPRKLAFRADIQGIRALAVLLVVVNHAKPGWLTGGFIGVDVFFVVSGFLITSLLVKEAGRSERISIAGFYARRARRIIPAATVVILVTVAIALWKLPLLRAQDILTDGIWSAFFGANIHMADVGTDYFAQGQPPSPLRHYWSLAVEEQFYLVWPLLLMLVLVVLRRRGAGGDDLARRFRRTAGVLITVAILASLAWSVYTTHVSPVTAYYSTFARAYELGFGAACALLLRPGSPVVARLSDGARQVLAAAGIVVIGASAVLLSEETVFPSGWALLPVLGTVALIVAGAGSGAPTAVGRVLSLRPATAVGDWSYSLYLWHWPVIVLGRAILGRDDFQRPPVLLGAIAFTFVLSWASYRFIENPFRGGPWKRVPMSLAIYPASIAVVVVAVVGGHQYVEQELTGGNNPDIAIPADLADEDPYTALVQASVRAAKADAPVPSDLTPGLTDLRSTAIAPLGDCDYRTGTTDLCAFGDPDADKTIVVTGDSYARAVSPAFDEIGKQDGYRVYVLVYSGCQGTTMQQIDRETGRIWDDCENFKTFARDTIADLQPDLTVVATSVGKLVDPESGLEVGPSGKEKDFFRVLEQGWTELFTQFVAESDRVVAFGNTPRLAHVPGECLTRRDPDLGDCAEPPGPKQERIAQLFMDTAKSVGAERVNAKKWFCFDDTCPAVVGSYITMRDTQHMTPDYARYLAPAIAASLDLPPLS